MKTSKDLLWTRFSPDEPRTIDRTEWMRHGGKWIVFDSSDMIEALAGKLGPFIDSGAIESAKLWNGDPSAINVYSFDRDRWKVREILKRLGARYVLAGQEFFSPSHLRLLVVFKVQDHSRKLWSGGNPSAAEGSAETEEGIGLIQPDMRRPAEFSREDKALENRPVASSSQGPGSRR
jgi:hypothetical protein